MNIEPEYFDKPVAVRANESPDMEKLKAYLKGRLVGVGDDLQIEQFPGGYSNLTFLLKSGENEFVLRKPPFGANIKSAHDMGREFKVLSALQPVYAAIPQPLLYCEDEDVLGTPFYIMQRVKGIILRNKIPKGLHLDVDTMRTISESAVDNLAKLHTIDLNSTGLIHLGKPEGYVTRQVEGWVKRYYNAQTEEVGDMDKTAEWLRANIPAENSPAFIHNDYKYDNLVLNPNDLSDILAVLDWEMATVGDPLMDLGTTLAYWGEAGDSEALKPFNLTWLEGNLNREQVLVRYQEKTGTDTGNFLFYYVFGSFKIAVIVQQIYARYKKGFTQDPRFASLIYVVKACAENAQQAIRYNRISNFY
ncbi:MAG TPA: phosphotransferase family protein [Chitinophagaceae bacterium]|nr:phosphotransferase family protein [Chitinophagaceae bacterium]